MSLRITLWPGPSRTQLLATYDGHDCLKALLPTQTHHPRAAMTLLEGLSLWWGTPADAAIVAPDPSDPSPVEALFRDVLVPEDNPLVHLSFLRPRKLRRIRGPADFARVYRVHGRSW